MNLNRILIWERIQVPDWTCVTLVEGSAVSVGRDSRIKALPIHKKHSMIPKINLVLMDNPMRLLWITLTTLRTCRAPIGTTHRNSIDGIFWCIRRESCPAIRCVNLLFALLPTLCKGAVCVCVLIPFTRRQFYHIKRLSFFYRAHQKAGPHRRKPNQQGFYFCELLTRYILVQDAKISHEDGHTRWCRVMSFCYPGVMGLLKPSSGHVKQASLHD